MLLYTSSLFSFPLPSYSAFSLYVLLNSIRNPFSKNGSGSLENAGPFQIRAREKEAQTSIVHKFGTSQSVKVDEGAFLCYTHYRFVSACKIRRSPSGANDDQYPG
jgi:hypothetical protein